MVSAQATLTVCLEAADRFEERASFRVFVFSIAKNQLYVAIGGATPVLPSTRLDSSSGRARARP